MPCLLCPSLLCGLLLLLFPLASSSVSNGDTEVITSSGPIKGKQFLAGLGSVIAYLGIPYAEPPLGKLRFQKPLPHQPWKQTLEATTFGNSCPQFLFLDELEAEIWSPKTPLSEDCLSLNIWVPHPQPSLPVPVLVWIHGGGYLGGTSSVDVFNGASLAATENVIVVTINYRLGALGFLYLPPAAPGNLGLWDQQLALKWIKENAAAFGGDPSRVTIFGQSVGGASVNFHLLAPKSQDLFAQAVIQSGTANAFWAWRSPEEAKQLSLEFVHLLGCSEDNNTSIMHCLQTKNVPEFIQHEISLFRKLGFFLNFPFKPTIDGDFLLSDPEKLMEEGQIQVKPVLIGKNSDEGGSVVHYIYSDINENLINQEQFLKGIQLLVPNATENVVQTFALRHSEGNHGPAQYRSALSQFFAHWVIACPLIEAAGNIRKTGSSVYAYLFKHHPSGSAWPEWTGAHHDAEIPYIFGTLESVFPINQTYTEAEARLSRKMMHYWAEFARTGNPDGLVATKDEWPLYNATEQNFFVLNSESSQETEKEPVHHCNFLKKHLSKSEDPCPPTHPTVAMPCLLCPLLLCCFLLLVPFPLASSSASNGDTEVITSSGPIKGKQFLAGLGSVTAYLGIPYAEPPLGKLRFQKPLPHQPWKQTLEATSFGNSCSQSIYYEDTASMVWNPKTPLSEDCLSLNIWVPYPQPSSAVPIFFWIHSGGYSAATSSLNLFNGASLAATENVIVVTINYRLGALGFLYLPPAAPGNLGLWDQQLALKWVKENAAAFGGDPSRVTIFGHSAGGASVNFHLLAPKSQDLFAQAVIQSGTANAFWAWRSPEEAKRLSLKFVHLLGCSEDNNTSIVHCLQTKSVSELIQQQGSLFLNYDCLLNFPFRPTIDGDFLLGDPEKLMEEGQIQDKPVLIGKVSDEGSTFIHDLFSDIKESLINQEQLLKGIRMLVPSATEDVVQTIALRYSEGHQDPAQYRSALSNLFTDLAIACPMIEAAGNIRKTGSLVYAYLFAHRPSSSSWPQWTGPHHDVEIAYIFGTLESVFPVNQTYTEAEARLSHKMMHYWAEFARTGNPDGLVATKDEWPLYNATEQNFFVLNSESSRETEKEPVHHCSFLKKHLSKSKDPHKCEGDSVSSD